jgi:hypothetical protein
MGSVRGEEGGCANPELCAVWRASAMKGEVVQGILEGRQVLCIKESAVSTSRTISSFALPFQPRLQAGEGAEAVQLRQCHRENEQHAQQIPPI